MSSHEFRPEEEEVATLGQAVFSAVLQGLDKAIADAGGPPLAAVLTEMRGDAPLGLDCLPNVADFHLADFTDRFAANESDARTAARRLRGHAGPTAGERVPPSSEIESMGIAALAQGVFRAALGDLEGTLAEPRWRERFARPFDFVAALEGVRAPGEDSPTSCE